MPSFRIWWDRGVGQMPNRSLNPQGPFNNLIFCSIAKWSKSLFGLSDISSTGLLKSNGRFLWSNLQAAFRWSIQSDLIQIIIIPCRLPHVTIHLVETYVQRPPADKDINSTLLMLIWMMVFAAQCKAFATGVTTHHIWPNLQTVRLRVQKYLCFLFPKVRSPSSGSLQKLQSGNNRCPELRSLTWKETKHVHYYFHRNLRGDRIGNQNTLKVSFYLPSDSKQTLLHIRSLEKKVYQRLSF